MGSLLNRMLLKHPGVECSVTIPILVSPGNEASPRNVASLDEKVPSQREKVVVTNPENVLIYSEIK